MLVSEIYEDIDFLAESSPESYPVADKLRNINIAYQQIATDIWSVNGEWEYDDSNASDLPIATTTLENGQQDYTLPSTCQEVRRVEILDSSGNYQLLKQRDIQDIPVATSEFLSGGGTPLYYDIMGRSILLFPIPATGYVTFTAGLKLYFNRDVTALTSTSNTPGFAVAFHRLLSYAAAIDYVRDNPLRDRLVADRERLRNRFLSFYSKRNIDGKVSIKPKSRMRQKQYE